MIFRLTIFGAVVAAICLVIRPSLLLAQGQACTVLRDSELRQLTGGYTSTGDCVNLDLCRSLGYTAAPGDPCGSVGALNPDGSTGAVCSFPGRLCGFNVLLAYYNQGCDTNIPGPGCKTVTEYCSVQEDWLCRTKVGWKPSGAAEWQCICTRDPLGAYGAGASPACIAKPESDE